MLEVELRRGNVGGRDVLLPPILADVAVSKLQTDDGDARGAVVALLARARRGDSGDGGVGAF